MWRVDGGRTKSLALALKVDKKMFNRSYPQARQSAQDLEGPMLRIASTYNTTRGHASSFMKKRAALRRWGDRGHTHRHQAAQKGARGLEGIADAFAAVRSVGR